MTSTRPKRKHSFEYKDTITTDELFLRGAIVIRTATRNLHLSKRLYSFPILATIRRTHPYLSTITQLRDNWNTLYCFGKLSTSPPNKETARSQIREILKILVEDGLIYHYERKYCSYYNFNDQDKDIDTILSDLGKKWNEMINIQPKSNIRKSGLGKNSTDLRRKHH